MSSRRMWIFAVALAAFFAATSQAWAWGPATHVKLAADLLSNLWLLPAGIATIISRHRKHFIYGNVATDTVLAKKMSKVKQICHRWQTGFSLLDEAKTEAGQAFAFGYLAHLSADTIAHNKFLPHQMAVSRSTITFGHLYW
ncbi:MAG TPA: zinc dependent phospholipase C family protein, partial [Phycisphaerae bacterium]|nr:zinc dependent phospholipase C family protein [Phycisphaerae bacterium]